MIAPGVSMCECGWSLPPITMRCKMRILAPSKNSEEVKAAAAAMSVLLDAGGKIDFIGIIDLKCPNCGTTFTQQGQVIPDYAAETRVLQ